LSEANESILTVLDPYSSNEAFPPVEIAWDEPDGLLAVGGDLSATRLINAYNSGIFPWFSPEEPIYWWAPDPRAVLYPHKIKFRRSLRKNMRNKGYRITFDHCFAEVVRACAAPRSYTDGTWITQAMYDAYMELHQLNIAHSVEVWNSDNTLVGGLYGINTGKIFSGESMFSTESDTSKIAFIALAYITQQRGYAMIDCQLENSHLFSMGAENISRKDYMRILRSTAILNINSLPMDNWKIEVDSVTLSHWRPDG
jgi:leucyl/phenylalanyl-tRNA--protein transferase